MQYPCITLGKIIASKHPKTRQGYTPWDCYLQSKILGEMCQARERQQRMASKEQVKKRVKPGIGLHGTMSVHILDIRVRIG